MNVEAPFNTSIAKLVELLRFPSISTHPDYKHAMTDCQNWLTAYLADSGFPCVELWPCEGHSAVFASWEIDPSLPTLLIYGHYDVQPPEPLELWESPPFEPEIREGYLYARGASDNKGQFMAHLEAIRLFKEQQGAPPINIKVFIEGEEEIGSPSLKQLLKTYKDKLSADVSLVSDTPMFNKNTPSICTSLRGLVYLEVSLEVMDSDLHSGQCGGVAPNAINLLCELMASCRNKEGDVIVDGFYDGIKPLSKPLKDTIEDLSFNADAFKKEQRCHYLLDAKQSAYERLWYLPTLDCNGIWGGYTGPGAKTILPAKAHAKLSMRLVSKQDPEAQLNALKRHLQKQCPKGAKLSFEVMNCCKAYEMDAEHPAIPLALKALEHAFEKKPVLQGEGGSIPFLQLFQEALGIDSLLMGLNFNDDNLHAPNERFLLDNYKKGIQASRLFMASLKTLKEK